MALVQKMKNGMLFIQWTTPVLMAERSGMNSGFSVDSSIQHLRRTFLGKTLCQSAPK